MRSFNRALFATIALTTAGLLFGGCQGSTRTGSLYTLKPDREIAAYVPGGAKDVHATALDVLESLEYTVNEERSDALEGIIRAKTARNDSVRVETYFDSKKVTRVEIWVGPLGDEQKSKEILSRLQERLSPSATAGAE